MSQAAKGFTLILALELGAAAALEAQAPSAQATPVFKSQIDLVNLPVTITDARSRYVSGLGQADFQVLEDGVPQDLSLFTYEDLPVSLSILLDTSQSMQLKLTEAQEAAVRFLNTLRPQDEAQVIHFNDKVRVLQDFTSEVPRLQAAVRATRASGATALYNALYVALKDLNAQRKTATLKRQAIVVLTDGEDTASLVNDEQVLDLARKTGIGVYGISLRSAAAPPLQRQDSGQPRFFFSTLTRETGGEAHFLQGLSQLKGVYDRVAEELRSQYSLGYVSSNAHRDGKWRNIVVRILHRANLNLRHKPGYYAPRD